MSEGHKPWVYIDVNKGYKAKIDAEDQARVEAHTWRVLRKETGRLKVVTNIKTAKGYRQVSLGQFLMNPPKGMMVYPRRFMDGLDYRKNNLIVCSMKERQRILPKSRQQKGTSRFKGVYYVSSKRKWRAGIKVDGRTVSLGMYATEDDAARAYNKAARHHFGDMAYQNQIKPRKNRRD